MEHIHNFINEVVGTGRVDGSATAGAGCIGRRLISCFPGMSHWDYSRMQIDCKVVKSVMMLGKYVSKL